ncbi:hypothetical protein AVEN_100664-1 [Araneus ventricosus]|uniref:Uncharacterized protein n=1 Tax=Araneus ventricosus TaxID=182803 RepID=A0A4Y2EIW2_ARAVE|nr:hypothetical protein AVEN_100664-1 [Araneus ventricosus]
MYPEKGRKRREGHACGHPCFFSIWSIIFVRLTFKQRLSKTLVWPYTNSVEGRSGARDPNRPKISKALYVRFGRQFLGEDSPPELLLGSHPELDSNRVNIVRRVFRRAQRIARFKNRRSVIDSDVLLAMPPQT